MKNKTWRSITLIPFLALLVVLFCNMKHGSPAQLQYAFIANESFPDLSKFELDLYSGHTELQKAANFISFSIRANSISELTSGKYNYSPKNASKRGKFKFLGVVKNDGKEISITDGSFKVKLDDENIKVEYDLTLADGTTVKGNYEGKYQTADWSRT